MNYKKKLNTIRPTLRHKKRYILLKLLDLDDINKFEPKFLFRVFCKQFQRTNGLISQIDANITLLESNFETKTVLIRINKKYVSKFISSLFFINSELGSISLLGIYNTIKSSIKK